jgi:hypothetical protein
MRCLLLSGLLLLCGNVCQESDLSVVLMSSIEERVTALRGGNAPDQFVRFYRRLRSGDVMAIYKKPRSGERPGQRWVEDVRSLPPVSDPDECFIAGVLYDPETHALVAGNPIGELRPCFGPLPASDNAMM